MNIEKQDLINKIETLNWELEAYAKKDPLPSEYRFGLVEEVKDWIEEIRNNKIKFINN